MTKIQKILLLFTFCIFFIACGNEETDTPLPYITVDVRFSLSVPPYNVALELYPSAIKIKYREAGYNGNGLIVVRRSENEFYAYDATCTRNINEEATSLDLDDLFFAKCPRCKTQYQVLHGAYETGGKFRLQEYRAYRMSNNMVQIIN